MKSKQIDLLIKLKNSSSVKIKQVTTDCSKKKLNLIQFLYKQGALQSFLVKGKILYVYPRYHPNSFSLLTKLKIVSRPSLSKILTLNDISKMENSNSIVGISTDIGLKSLYECKQEKLGGKILFII